MLQSQSRSGAFAEIKSFASPAELTLRLFDRLEKDPAGATVVQVMADRDLPYGQVLAVLSACRAAGAARVALLARQHPRLP
jgi:biopolymer transport protein ExbD